MKDAFQTTFEQPVSIEHDGQTYSYLFTINLLGEVVSFENLLLKMPEPALQLIFGEAIADRIAFSDRLAHFVKYMIPLEFFGLNYLEDIEDDFTETTDRLIDEDVLKTIKDRISQERQSLGLPSKAFPPASASSDWMKHCCELLEQDQKGGLNPKQHTILRWWMRCFTKHPALHEYLPRLSVQKERLTINLDLVKAYWPLCDEFRKPYTSTKFKLRTDNIKELLIKMLEGLDLDGLSIDWLMALYDEEQSHMFRTRIISLLRAYKESAIYSWLIEELQKIKIQSSSVRDPGLQAVLGALTRFSAFFTPAIIPLVRPFLQFKRRQGNVHEYMIYCILKNCGWSDMEIMDEVRPWFYDKEEKERYYSLMGIFAFLIDDKSLLPSVKDLVEFS
ncbi:MAG: hypothetical protein AAF361_04040, partial [Bacteroidota bacterium]